MDSTLMLKGWMYAIIKVCEFVCRERKTRFACIYQSFNRYGKQRIFSHTQTPMVKHHWHCTTHWAKIWWHRSRILTHICLVLVTWSVSRAHMKARKTRKGYPNRVCWWPPLLNSILYNTRYRKKGQDIDPRVWSAHISPHA